MATVLKRDSSLHKKFEQAEGILFEMGVKLKSTSEGMVAVCMETDREYLVGEDCFPRNFDDEPFRRIG